MTARLGGFLGLLAAVLAAAGCSDGGPKVAQVSGKVTFKGQPVPAGYISFAPTSGASGEQVRVVQIKDGVYDSSKEPTPGVFPGPCVVRIAGFDGKGQKFWPQGKQIFNPYELKETVPAAGWTKDFDIPASAAHNLKIEPTADD